MHHKILRFWRGCVVCRLEGARAARYLDDFTRRGGEIQCLREADGGYCCRVLLPDYRRMLRESRTYRFIPHVISRFGLPFLLHRYRRRKALAAGLLLALGILYGMSFFLWEVPISGNGYYSDAVLLRFLRENGIFPGKPMSLIGCDELEQLLRDEYPAITWVSLYKSGTKLCVELRENTQVLEAAPTRDQACDLVASADGVIESIITREGTPLVKAGDVVREGDVLVSGQITLTGDDGSELGTVLTRADADIVAHTQEQAVFDLPAIREVRRAKGRYPCGFSLSLLGQSIRLQLPKLFPQSYTITEHRFPGPDDLSRPYAEWTISHCFLYECVLTPKSEEEYTREAELLCRDYLDALKADGSSVSNAVLHCEPGGCRIVATLHYRRTGKFGRERSLARPDEEQEKDDLVYTGNTGNGG